MKYLPIALISLVLLPLAAHADTITFSGAATTTAEATSSAGAYVPLTVSAENASSTSLTVSCTPPSMSLFALGTTTVSCSASDASTTASTSFGVIVKDTTPPAITPPPTQTFATSAFPAYPTLTFATATDTVDSSPSITYSPTSFNAGTTTVTWTATDNYHNSAATTSLVVITDTASSTNATSTPVSASTTPTVSFSIRDGSVLIGPAALPLATTSTSTVDIAATGTTTVHAVSADSVLALLSAYDATSSDFSTSDLEYYSAYGEFYVNCITVPAATSSPQCGEWQYEINGASPGVGMDQETLSSGDSVIVYFGAPRRTELFTSTVAAGTPFTATAEAYDPSTDTYATTTGVTLGVISVPVPSTPWVYTEIATSSTDASGQAIFTLDATGTYQVGIQEDYYSPSASLTVIATSSATSPPSGGSSGGSSGSGSSGGGGGTTHHTLDMAAALTYLESQQNADGSFDTPELSDWAALALKSAAPNSSAFAKLKHYELTAKPTMANVTDYERHAIALEALGINPYNGTSANYISPIVQSFDGTQIGDPSEDNDDIFGVLALLSTGYAPSDPMLEKVGSFILSKEKADGSWDESPDLTAAALQVLPNFFVGSDISPAALGAALGAGEVYLINTQHADGGWSSSGSASNVDSTSWVQTFINAVALDDPANARTWTSSGGLLPTDVIASAQQGDGGVDATNEPADTRTWSTEYAIVAASGKDWDSQQQPFTRPASASIDNSSAFVGTISATGATSTSATSTSQTAASTAATSTISTASTTPPLATSTPIVATSTASTTPRVLGASTSTPHRPVKPAPAVPHHAAPAPSPKPSASSTPATTTRAETAAAGSSLEGGTFFSGLWHAVSSVFSFFAHLF